VLGYGSRVMFSDNYTVRFGRHEESAGVPVLIVTTCQPMQVRPTGSRDEIIIART